MARFDSSRAIVHQNVALLSCDSSVTLMETLRLLADLELDAMQVGDTALVFPASQLPKVQAALHAQACYPKVIGEQAPEPSFESEEPE